MKNFNTALVSIIIPCYNQASFLAETLDSVLQQTYGNWECIIVNDGSPDNTEQIAQRYCDKDPRFKYLYKNNGGLSSARNAGIKYSKGKYILPLDSDDKIASNYLLEATDILKSNDEIKIVYCKAKFFGVKSGLWNIPEFSLEKMLGSNLIFCSAFFRRSDYMLTQGYNENMKFGFEDWDFWLTLLENGGEVYRIDKVMFYYRTRHGSMSNSLNKERQSYLRRQIWENHRKLYSENFFDPTMSFEYIRYADSMEYKIGSLIIRPFRKLKFFLFSLKEFFSF